MIAQLALVGIAVAAPPRLTAALVRQTEAALEILKAHPGPVTTRATLRRLEGAMDRIRQGVDAYFHAPNLEGARTEALAMRAVMRRLRADPRPVMAVVDDVLRFDPILHDRLAEGCAAIGDARCAREHRVLALIGAPSEARRAAARATLAPSDHPRFDARFKAAAAPPSTPE